MYILAVVVVLSVVLFLGLVGPSEAAYAFLFVFLIPAYVGAYLTGPFARALGGELTVRRSSFITLTSLALALPIALVWRIVVLLLPAVGSSLVGILLLLQAPILWFRHMSVFGISRPSNPRSLPPALLPPLLSAVAVLALFQPGWPYYVAAAFILAFGYLASLLLLWASDRPLHRAFGISGVALLRPMMDHVETRDPEATDTIERFFDRFSVPMDLRVGVLAFRSEAGPVATVVMPTVHPGPFASLGASDLPHKISARLAGTAGVVLVPHTPCNHDQDLPSREEADRVANAAQSCVAGLGPPAPRQGSPLVAPRPGALARAQVIGDTVVVIVSQAPAPTDDIDYAIGDQVYQTLRAEAGLRVALLDAHNSYREGEGDLSYGSPGAGELLADARAAVAAARNATVPGSVRVGVHVQDGYDTAGHGIGPEGIRCLVVEAAGRRTAYVLIDGNNLLEGLRAQLLAALEGVVDDAEVLTTDNHVVHEVDGGVNPVGERYAIGLLARDVRAGVEHALSQMRSVEVRSGETPVPSVRVLQPAWTVRLMTALSDTFVVFTSALLSTFLLVIMASLVVVVLLV